MEDEELTITLRHEQAAVLLYGCQAFVSLLTGQLADAGAALNALSDDAGIALYAEAVATLITTVQHQLTPEGMR